MIVGFPQARASSRRRADEATNPKLETRQEATAVNRRVEHSEEWASRKSRWSMRIGHGEPDVPVWPAEEVGFEPTVPRSGTPVFETGPFNHSGTPPVFVACQRSLEESRRSWKNRLRISPQSSAKIPAVVGTR